jgi:hypothetical protein
VIRSVASALLVVPCESQVDVADYRFDPIASKVAASTVSRSAQATTLAILRRTGRRASKARAARVGARTGPAAQRLISIGPVR